MMYKSEDAQSYDLLTEGWLPALGRDGRLRPVGLVEAMLSAHDLRWIDAEAPVVTAALHRLLLAFAHREPNSSPVGGLLVTA